ncbi:MAG: TraB/GumN family protein [Chlamydiales bacterium]
MTINIIKKWENIGKNYLDLNLEYTQDFSQKITLNQALHKSIELLPNEIEDVGGVFQAFYEIEERILDKPFKFQAKNPAHDAHSDLKKEIANRLAKKYSYQELSAYYLEFSKKQEQGSLDLATVKKIDIATRKLLELTYNLLYQKEVRDITNNRGIAYKIENEKECSSYLIGTLHLPNLLRGSKLSEIIKNSSQFFWESEKEEELVLLPEEKIDESQLDLALAKIAFIQKIPIHALETIEELSITFNNADEEYSSLSMEDKQKKSDLEYNKIEKLALIEEYKKFKSTPTLLRLETLNAWRKGDSKTIQNIVKIQKAAGILSPQSEIIRREAKQRNKNWLKKHNLVNKLLDAEKPISIVVGLFHLFGKSGLLKAFEDQGLKIQQI